MMISSHWQLCIVYCCWSVTQCVQLFVTPWTAACQASLSFTISEFAQAHVHWVGDAIQPSLRPLLLPSIFPAWESFSSKSALHIRWPEYCTFSFSISPSNEYQGWFPLGLTLLSYNLWKFYHPFISTLSLLLISVNPFLWSACYVARTLLDKGIQEWVKQICFLHPLVSE